MKYVATLHFFTHTTTTSTTTTAANATAPAHAANTTTTFNVSVFNVLYFFSQRKMNGLLTML